jgi:hypothetical protein
MCTMFLKIEFTPSLTLMFITNLTTILSLRNNNYAGDFQGPVIGLYNPFVVTLLLVMKVLTVISYLSGVFATFYYNKTLTLTNTISIIYDINILTQMII